MVPKPKKRAGHAFCHRNSSSVFTTELQAIYFCLEYILSNPQLLNQPALIVSDSLAAPSTISDTNSSYPFVSRILVQLSSLSQ